MSGGGGRLVFAFPLVTLFLPVHRYHPDRNRGKEDEATEKFKEAKEAFDVLSDPKKRKIFDKYGEEGLAEGGPGGGGMDDVFSRFFGGGRGGGDDEEDSGRGEDMKLKMGVELSELFNGSVRRVPMQKQFVCAGCQGSGSSKPGAGKQCTACQGQGMRMEMRQMGPFVTQQPVECRRCNGEGVMIAAGDECKACGGRRVMQRQHILEIPIERGLASGDKVVLPKEANQVPGEEPGDIIVFIVEQTPDDFPFTRNKDDLLYRQKISLTEALIGFKFSLKHMDGRTLVVTSQPGDVIKPGSKKVVLGEGMPIKGMPSERGRLIIEFEVEFPGPEFITEEVRTGELLDLGCIMLCSDLLFLFCSAREAPSESARVCAASGRSGQLCRTRGRGLCGARRRFSPRGLSFGRGWRTRPPPPGRRTAGMRAAVKGFLETSFFSFVCFCGACSLHQEKVIAWEESDE